MAIISREQLKKWFRRGMYPLESQFADWIDSFWHKNDALPISSVDGLADAINGKADASALEQKQDKEDENLQTNNKTVVGAINEVYDGLGPYDAQATSYTSDTAADEGLENVEEALDALYAAKAEEMTEEDINSLNWN